MYRYAMERLKAWKNSESRKPLMIRGARQVGKTWLMKEFARIAYTDSVYINFENNPQMESLFSSDYNIPRLVEGFEIYVGKKIDPYNTLLIFDEVQQVPKALSSLKYFAENAGQYHILCAGSLLGVALHSGTSFPVGNVDFLDLFPLSFFEFLEAMGKGRFVDILAKGDYGMACTFKSDLINLLKHYYFIGGMPEVVSSFVERHNFTEVREIQKRILNAYEQDFSKHAPHEAVPRIQMLWNSVPSQLSKENRKFVYGQVREGSRAKDYELALFWLVDCGLLHKVHRVNSPHLPLCAYEDLKSFKLYMVDVGLLSCMTGLHERTILEGSKLFTEFKGALTEQYVLQQLKTLPGIGTWYWTNERSSAEIDFLLDTGSDVIPLEVKAEINLQAKSLKVFRERFSPRLSLRSAMTDYKIEEGLINLPLYAIETVTRLIQNS